MPRDNAKAEPTLGAAIRKRRKQMQLEQRAQLLNTRLTTRSAAQALRVAIDAPELGDVALVSSFGAEAAVLLHLVAVSKPDLPVIFLDTGKHFTETLVYAQELVERFGLSNVRFIAPDPSAVSRLDSKGDLHARNSDACCAIRKSDPMQAALTAMPTLGALITGRKRYQGGPRARLEVFEADLASGLIKVNPLARWLPADIAEYMDENRLPKHPLLAKGYLSIGCAPCTSPVAQGEDARAGRWRGHEKSECGIHFINGRAVRGPVSKAKPEPKSKKETA